MSQIWDIYCKHCLWSIFGPCWCTKSCKTTFYAHLSRIWKLARFTRFIRKVFATKILLSGKFLLFATLRYIYSIQKNARYISSSSVFTAFITYVGAQLRRKPLYSIVLLLKLFAKPLPKFQIIQMQLMNHLNKCNHLIIQSFDKDK